MKTVNKVVIVGVLTVGIGAGAYMNFAGRSEPVMTYKTSEVLEKQIENQQKFAGEVIPNGMEIISFDPTKGNSSSGILSP